MKAIIRGFRPVDYVKNDSGEEVKGVQLFFNVPSSDVIGYKNKEEFVRSGSSVYKIIEPYLSGDIDSLLNVEAVLDYDVSKYGAKTVAVLADLTILSKAV